MSRMGMINSGGNSSENNSQKVVKTAVIKKRPGGMGAYFGKVAIQKPMKEGIALLNAVQDVYLAKNIPVA